MSTRDDDFEQVKALARLSEVCRLRLDEPGRRPALDLIAERVAHELDTPIGLVTVALDEAQVFLGGYGLTGWMAEVGGTPLEWSFCRHVVGSGREYVVGDAAGDPVMRDSPLVRVEGIRAYAGVPLVSGHGYVLGALCVKDRAPRHFGAEAVGVLRREAERTALLLETAVVQDVPVVQDLPVA